MADRQPVPGEYRAGQTCCQPTDPPSSAAYKRHSRAGTVPCSTATKDSAAYRLARKHATEETR